MANKKISAFDTISTLAINLSDVLGVAAYCDDPSSPGTDINVSFSGQDIIDTYLWKQNSNADNIYYDVGSVNIGTNSNYNNIPLTIAGTGTSSMSTAMNVFDNLEVAAWFTLRDDKRLFYKDGNQASGYALVSDAVGMGTWQAVVNSIDFSTTGLTPNTATTGAVTVAGTLAVGHGGTGLTSYTIGDIIYADTASTLSQLNAGTAGDVLTSNGAGVAPSYQTPSGGTAKGIINGAADEVGASSTAVSNPKQVSWSYPTVSSSAYGPCMTVPIDMTVTNVSIKWQNTNGPTIPADPAGVVDWSIGKLTNTSDPSDTQNGTVNYTNIANLTTLTVNNSDSGTNFFKSWSGTAAFSAGDILVLLHSNPASSWTGTGVSTGDVVVSMAVEYP